MFSGCYEDNLDHDSEGRVFLDFDPQLFQSILSSLRCCNIRDSATPVPLQKVDNSKLAAYLDLVKYLGLEECMGYHTHKPNLVQAERFYCISQEGQHAKLQNSSYKERSLTLEKIVTDVGYMKFTWRPRRMHGHENQLSVGVADLSHVKNGCAPFCGWQIEGTSLSADGVWIIIKADMRTGKLTMLELNSSPRHKCFSASSWGKCVFQVAMNIDESEIELFPVTAEDQHMFL